MHQLHKDYSQGTVHEFEGIYILEDHYADPNNSTREKGLHESDQRSFDLENSGILDSRRGYPADRLRANSKQSVEKRKEWKPYGSLLIKDPSSSRLKVKIKTPAGSGGEKPIVIDFSYSFHSVKLKELMKMSDLKLPSNIARPKEILLLRRGDSNEVTIWLLSSNYSNAIEKLLFDLYFVFRFSEKSIEKQISLRFQRIFFKAVKNCLRNLVKRLSKEGDLSLEEPEPEINGLNSKELFARLRRINTSEVTCMNMLLKPTVFNAFIVEGLFPVSCDIIKNDFSSWDWLKKIFTNKMITPWSEKFHTSFTIGEVVYDFNNSNMVMQKIGKEKMIFTPRPIFRTPILDFFPLDYWVDTVAIKVFSIIKINFDDLSGCSEEELNWKDKSIFKQGVRAPTEDSELPTTDLDSQFRALAKSFLSNYGEILFKGNLLENICWSIVKTEVTPYEMCTHNCQTPVSKLIYFLNESLGPYLSSIVTDIPLPDIETMTVDSDISKQSLEISASSSSNFDGMRSNKLFLFEGPEVSRFRKSWNLGVMTLDTMLDYYGIWADKYQRFFLKKINSLLEKSEKVGGKHKATQIKAPIQMSKEPEFVELSQLEQFFLDSDEGEIKLEKFKLLNEKAPDSPILKNKVSYLFFKLRNKYLRIRMKLKRIKLVANLLRGLKQEKEPRVIHILSAEIQRKLKEKCLSNLCGNKPLNPEGAESYITALTKISTVLRTKKRGVLAKLEIMGPIYFNSVRLRNTLKIVPGGISYIGYLVIRDPQVNHESPSTSF